MLYVERKSNLWLLVMVWIGDTVEEKTQMQVGRQNLQISDTTTHGKINKLGSKGHVWPPSIFANKVLLDYSHSNLLTYRLCLLSQFKGKVQ